MLMQILQSRDREIMTLSNRPRSGANGLWKIIASVSGTALLAISSLWFTYGQNAVTKDDLREMLAPIEKSQAEHWEKLEAVQAEHGQKLEALRLSIWEVDTAQRLVEERLGIQRKK